jgi:hypothetical protein
MINRNYFYSGEIEKPNGNNEKFDGVISVRSWLPIPARAWATARKNIQSHAADAGNTGRVSIITMNRI